MILNPTCETLWIAGGRNAFANELGDTVARCGLSRAGVAVFNRQNPRDRCLPIEDGDAAAPPDPRQVAREIVLQVGYFDYVHIAMLAI